MSGNGGGPRDRAPGGWGASRSAGSIFDLLRGWSAPLAWSAAGSVVLGGCADMIEQRSDVAMQRALDQQESSGWNTGAEWKPLVFPGARDTDITGGARWRDEMMTMAARLAPASGRWTPYYNPTLFQSLETPRNADLRAVVRPILTQEMWMAWRRGDALRSLLTQDGTCRTDVALVLDLPGPEATAVAAALAPCVDPVFVFANWPHPLGVVPAHQTLAAALYFLPSFEADRPKRGPAAPPAFVLDRNRLAHYQDYAGQFDNRYLAGLPPPDALRSAGIRHILYVTPDDQVTEESDDLNDDLVAIDDGGVKVGMLALSDFAWAPLPGWPAVPACAPIAPTPTPTGLTNAPATQPPPVASGSAMAPAPVASGPAAPPPLYFGGSPEAQSCFAYWYGWLDPDPPSATTPPPGPTPLPLPASGGGVHFSFVLPPRLAPRCHFHPSPRATASFAGHGSRLGGGFRGHFGMGGGFHRSGSLGRVHSGGFG